MEIEALGDGVLGYRKLDAPKLKTLPESIDKLKQEGYTAFSLGPLYIYAGIAQNILNVFASDECVERGLTRQPTGFPIHFKHPFLSYCEDWNYKLDVLDSFAFDIFNHWMLSQVFINRDERDVFVPRRYKVMVLDPLALMVGDGKRIPTTLDVYGLTGTKFTVRPVTYCNDKSKLEHFIKLEKVPVTEPHVVDLGKALLA